MFNQRAAILLSSLALIAGTAFAANNGAVTPAFAQMIVGSSQGAALSTSVPHKYGVVVAKPRLSPFSAIDFVDSLKPVSANELFEIPPTKGSSLYLDERTYKLAEQSREAMSWIFLLGGVTCVIMGLCHMFKPAKTQAQRVGHISVGIAMIVIGVAIPAMMISSFQSQYNYSNFCS